MAQCSVALLAVMCITVYLAKGADGAPLSSDVDVAYEIDLFNPCGSAPTLQTLASTGSTSSGFPIAVLDRLGASVSSLKSLLVTERLHDKFWFDNIRDQYWFTVTDFYTTYGTPSTSSNEGEILQELWQNAIWNTVHLRQARYNETVWAGPSRMRSPTFESQLTILERDYLSQLLCAVKLYSESRGEYLRSHVEAEAAMKAQEFYANTFYEGDMFLYMLLNGLENDYIKFSKAFYAL